MNRIKRILKNLFRPFITCWCKPIINGYWGGFWNYREHLQKHPNKLGEILYINYMAMYGAWISLDAKIASAPKCPHGCYGIFISKAATIGRNCVVFQQVTIGSVTTVGSRHIGAPNIGNNVYIGAGAKIVGNVKVGHNVRIGANCVVTQDIPENCVVYMSGINIIKKDITLDNTFSTECLNDKKYNENYWLSDLTQGE